MKPGPSTTERALNVVLCWHMHQPDYRLEGRWQRPWTWLHALKDYTDMAAHLERVPGARAVVNFSPVLLVQLQDLAVRLDTAIGRGGAIGEPLLDALAGHPIDDEAVLQRALLRVHEQNMAWRFAPYRRLSERAAAALSAGTVLPLAERDDLLCWFTLCWLGESAREDPRALALHAQAERFSEAQRRLLLDLVTDQIAGLLPRYRALADARTIELSVTPYSHPMLPLLLDFHAAAEAMPGVPLPDLNYPGGAGRCDWQLAEAIAVFRGAFGRTPRGCWPSEGGLSSAALEAIGRHGFAWTASGSAVLRNSLDAHAEHAHLRPWRLHDQHGPACFFRDDGLSDRIGFVYATWSPTDAIADFVHHLEQIHARLPRGEPAALAIIMDGENAWEYYDRNGWEFLQRLYRELAAHPTLRLTTFSDVLPDLSVRSLPRLMAGSWVHGTFSTWIGAAARNRAWSLLVEAKLAVDAAFHDGSCGDVTWRQRVERQLAVCEASDWFWWLEEGNPHPDVEDFDALFRAQLAVLYRLIDREPPERLLRPVREPGPAGEPASRPSDESTMHRSGAES